MQRFEEEFSRLPVAALSESSTLHVNKKTSWKVLQNVWRRSRVIFKRRFLIVEQDLTHRHRTATNQAMLFANLVL